MTRCADAQCTEARQCRKHTGCRVGNAKTDNTVVEQTSIVLHRHTDAILESSEMAMKGWVNTYKSVVLVGIH